MKPGISIIKILLLVWAIGSFNYVAQAQRRPRTIVSKTVTTTVDIKKTAAIRKKTQGKKIAASQIKPKPRQTNYLLLVGVDKYTHWRALNTPKKDAQALKKILIEKYDFDNDYVFELYNQQFTKENFTHKIEEINSLTRDFGNGHDNLIIFYSGHGHIDDNSQKGYWVPASARKNILSDYIPNRKIKQYIGGFTNIKNILVIADACFAGAFFTDKDENNTPKDSVNLKSRWGLTSSNFNKAKDGKISSPFMKILLSYLCDYRKEKLPVSELIEYMKNNDSNKNNKEGYVGRQLTGVGDQKGKFILENRPAKPGANHPPKK